jgi:hypothetical protein
MLCLPSCQSGYEQQLSETPSKQTSNVFLNAI